MKKDKLTFASSPHHTFRMKQARQCFARLLESQKFNAFTYFFGFVSAKPFSKEKSLKKPLKSFVIYISPFFLRSYLKGSFAKFERFTSDQHMVHDHRQFASNCHGGFLQTNLFHQFQTPCPQRTPGFTAC